jgi:hypothetical protein
MIIFFYSVGAILTTADYKMNTFSITETSWNKSSILVALQYPNYLFNKQYLKTEQCSTVKSCCNIAASGWPNILLIHSSIIIIKCTQYIII